MEAATLKKKKTTISKGKIKKTMKNVLCRPDPMFWPVVSEEHSKELENIFQKFKVQVPEFKKPHWSEIKALPKEERLKAPKPKKVEGLLFGLTTCCKAIASSRCDGIIIDAEVNPRILVQHVIEAGVTAQIPVLCLKELKKVTTNNFGFPTCCLGVNKDENCMSELRSKILEISKNYRVQSNTQTKSTKMEIAENNCTKKEDKSTNFTYLYRTSKKTRVFTPPTNRIFEKKPQSFIGQDFIGFSGGQENQPVTNSKSYMSMIVKRITNNPNRKTE